jgi:hypothetical protein
MGAWWRPVISLSYLKIMRVFIIAMASGLTTLEIWAAIVGVFPRWPGHNLVRADEPIHFWTVWQEMAVLTVMSWICVWLSRRPRPPKAPYEK